MARTPRPLLPVYGDPTKLRVELTKGKYAIIDAEDAHLIESHSWSTQVATNTCYGRRSVKSNGKCATVHMHRHILGVTDPNLEVHHIDGNGLNNCKSNLRQLSCLKHRQITYYEGRNNVTSPYAYVFQIGSFKDGAPKWRASLGLTGKCVYFGDYRDERLAAQVGDLGAVHLYGPEAYRNFPEASPEARLAFRKYLLAHEVPRANMHSAYKGVTRQYVRSDGWAKWCAQLVIEQGDVVKAAGFNTEEEAAQMFDALAIHFRGEDAERNFTSIPPTWTRYRLSEVLERRALRLADKVTGWSLEPKAA